MMEYYIISAPLYAVSCLIGMFLMMELGRKVGRRQLARDPGRGLKGVSSIDGALFALFGLLLAFTFSGAASRFDSRRLLIAQESNEIGTAYMRLDLLPNEVQPPLRALFRSYIDARISAYRALPDIAVAQVELKRAEKFQREIWNQAVTATRRPDTAREVPILLLPAINSMIDITTIRFMSALLHPAPIIYILLFVLGLACALLAGYTMAQEKYHNWLHISIFAITMSAVLFVIVDIEYPRAGLIRLDSYDQVLIDVRDSMQ
jgi:hypothetical protein